MIDDNNPRLEREINAAAIRVVQAWAMTLADIAALEETRHERTALNDQ